MVTDCKAMAAIVYDYYQLNLEAELWEVSALANVHSR